MKAELIIREAAKSDFDQWRLLFDQYNAFYGRVGNTALSDEIVSCTWNRFFEPDKPVHCLVSQMGDQLVGLAHYIFHPNTITIEDTCYLQDLFTAPDYRGEGIGKRLIDAFYRKAELAGTQIVYWHTHSTNQTAMKLYDQVAKNTEFVVYRKNLGEEPK